MSTRNTRAAQPPHRVTVIFVGAGSGDPALLTVRAVEALGAADVVVVNDMVSTAPILGYLREDAGVSDLSDALVRRGSMSGTTPLRDLSDPARHVIAAAEKVEDEKGHIVVRLVDGCATSFSGLGVEVAAVRAAGYDVEVVPGVHPVASAPAFAGVPLGTGGSPELSVWCVGSGSAGLASAIATDATALLVGSLDQVSDGLASLIVGGRDESTPVAVVEAAMTTSQRTTFTTLGHASGVAASASRSLSSLMAIVGDAAVPHSGRDWFESKPLFGWRVLVPRTKDQAGPMVRRLTRYGAAAEVVPTISVEPPRTPGHLHKAVSGLVTGRYTWVGFTSANAVRAIRDKFSEFGLDARTFAGLKIAAVGGVTANALREWGLEPDLVPATEESSHGLLHIWPAYDPQIDPLDRVLLPRADIATETLVAGLIKLGWTVDDVTAYRTVRAAPPPAPVRQAIKNGDFDAVIFTSSSTVRNLVGIAGKPHPSTVVACIGPATAATAQEHGLTVHVVAETANSVALVDALAAYGRSLAVDTGHGLRTPLPRQGRSTRRRTVQG